MKFWVCVWNSRKRRWAVTGVRKNLRLSAAYPDLLGQCVVEQYIRFLSRRKLRACVRIPDSATLLPSDLFEIEESDSWLDARCTAVVSALLKLGR